MPIPTFTKLGPSPSFDDLVKKVNVLSGELSNLMLNLDSLNVVSLTADHIDAGTIDANVVTIRSDLTAGAYVQIDGNGMVINNGSINTFTANINGNVTMTSATIRSLASGERVEIDSTGLHTYDAFGFERITIGTAPVEGVKAITFRDTTGAAKSVMVYDTETVDGSSRTGQYIVGPNAQYLLLSDDGDIRIQNDQLSGFRAVSSSRPEINSGGGGWEAIAFKSEVDTKATAGSSTSTDGSHNHGIPNGTVLMVDGGGTVTFVTSGSHSHTQT